MVAKFGDFSCFEYIEICQIQQEAVAALAATPTPTPALTTLTTTNTSAKALIDGGQTLFSMRVQVCQNSPQKKRQRQIYWESNDGELEKIMLLMRQLLSFSMVGILMLFSNVRYWDSNRLKNL